MYNDYRPNTFSNPKSEVPIEVAEGLIKSTYRSVKCANASYKVAGYAS